MEMDDEDTGDCLPQSDFSSSPFQSTPVCSSSLTPNSQEAPNMDNVEQSTEVSPLMDTEEPILEDTVEMSSEGETSTSICNIDSSPNTSSVTINQDDDHDQPMEAPIHSSSSPLANNGAQQEEQSNNPVPSSSSSSSSFQEVINVNNTENTKYNNPISSELYFLIWKFLSQGPCKKAFEALQQEIDIHSLMPPRVDWMGRLHPQSLSQVDQTHPHISLNHLRDICSRIPSLLDQTIPAAIPGVMTLLGNGRQSLLRTSTSNRRKLTSNQLSRTVNGSLPLHAPCHTHSSHPDHIPVNVNDFVFARQICGLQSTKTISSKALYSKIKCYRRLLGHLCSVYCVSFDRSGRYIFTGADDSLVKIWSAFDGRLLATLRGHSKPVTDFAVNPENTLLATGSIDKQIRIWCLRTTAPITILSGHTAEITCVKFCPFIKSPPVLVKDKNRNKLSKQQQGKLKEYETKDSLQRYLVSTAQDGTICFWSFNIETKEFNPQPHKFTERSRPGCHILCSSFSPGGVFLAVGSTDCCVRVYHVDGPCGPTKILEIEEHTDLVDSIQFANRSTRFVSGSKDGIAHIWSFEKQKWNNIPLKMSERLASDPVLDELELKKIKVNMISWTCDDSFIITPASDFTIKIWDSSNGKLLHSIKHHTNDAFVIETHPHDPRIFFTGAHDGNLVLWDAFAGRPLQSFVNVVEGQGAAAILDGKWSRDGLMFAAADIMGHLIIYGFGEPKCYEKVPDHVFFHTDYRPLLRDNNNYVIDEQTQCPPHLMPPPFLVDIDGNPHPPKFQRLVPGRENCKDDQLVPYIAVHDDQAQVMQPVGDQPAVQQQQHRTIDDMIQILQQQREARLGGNSSNPGPSNVSNASAPPAPSQPAVPESRPSSAAGPSSSNPVPRRRNPSSHGESNRNRAAPVHQAVNAGNAGVAQSSGNWQSRNAGTALTHSVWMRRVVVRSLPPSELKYCQEAAKKLGRMENHFYEFECKRRCQLDLEEESNPVDDADSNQIFTRRVRRINEQRQGVSAASQRQQSSSRMNRNMASSREISRAASNVAATLGTRYRSNNRGTIADYDFEEDDDEEYEVRLSGAETWTNSSSSDSDDSDSDEDSSEDSDDESSSSPPRRPMRGNKKAKNTRGKRNRDLSSDEDEEENNEDNDDHVMDTSASAAETEGTHPSDRDTPVAGPSRGHPRRASSSSKKLKPVKKRSVSKKEQELFDEYNSKDLDARFKFPEWLSETSAKKTPYFPQKGDEVVYFKRGHLLYLEEVLKKSDDDGGYDLPTGYIASINKKKCIKEQVFAVVTDMKYEVKPPRLVSLKLSVMNEEGGLTKEVFHVRYHDMPNVIDFLVLKQHYDLAMENNDYWVPGVRFKSIIDNLWWFGTIEGRVKEAKTPFQSIRVKWDNEDYETMSPWDIERIDEATQAELTLKAGVPITENDRENMMYKSNFDDWPSCGIDAESDRIIAGLNEIMEHAMSEPFNVPVDIVETPIYAMVTPYMIDLTTIKERLRNRFYRRKDALKFDVSFIFRNAKEFNEDGSEVIVKAKMLDHVLNAFIDDVECFDPKPIVKQAMENREDFELCEETDEDGDYEEENEEDAGTRRSQRTSAKKRMTPDERRSLSVVRVKQSKKTWKQLCKELIKELFTLEDSKPFRSAVDPIKYPDYYTAIDTPMDLTTVNDELCSGNYDNLKEFKKDIMLIFSNSKSYNDKSKKIYTQTIRLEKYIVDRLADISRGYSRCYTHHEGGSKKKKKKKAQSKVVQNLKRVTRKPAARVGGSSSIETMLDPDAPGPSGLCQSRDGPSTSRALSSNVGNGVRHQEDSEGSETEVESGGEDNNEENEDTDATEIDEEDDGTRESFASSSSKENKTRELKASSSAGQKRKKPVKGQGPAKKMKKQSKNNDSDYEFTDSDLTEEASCDEETDRTHSRSSHATSLATVSEDEYDVYARKTRGRRNQRSQENNINRPRTRNNCLNRVKQEPKYDDSEFEHDSVFMNQGQNVSSRGRVIKFKGRQTEQVC